jgi:hypothetical protein
MQNSPTATAIATSVLLTISIPLTTTIAFLNLSQLPAISQDIDSLPTPAALSFYPAVTAMPAIAKVFLP